MFYTIPVPVGVLQGLSEQDVIRQLTSIKEKLYMLMVSHMNIMLEFHTRQPLFFRF